MPSPQTLQSTQLFAFSWRAASHTPLPLQPQSQAQFVAFSPPPQPPLPQALAPIPQSSGQVLQVSPQLPLQIASPQETNSQFCVPDWISTSVSSPPARLT